MQRQYHGGTDHSVSLLQVQQQLAAALKAQAEAEAHASQVEGQLQQLQVTLTASQEKNRADHLVLAKEIKRLRGEVAALQQVGCCWVDSGCEGVCGRAGQGEGWVVGVPMG